MNTKIASMMIEYIAASSALTDRLLGDTQRYRAQEKAAAAKQSSTLETMLRNDCVGPNEKQAAASMLADHGQTLDLLVNAVNKMAEYRGRSEKIASDLGRPVADPAVKTASYDSLNDPFVGRHSSQKKASDLALLRVLRAPGS
jgi:hypothetical protein